MDNVTDAAIGALPPELLDHAVRSAFECIAGGRLTNPARIETLGRSGDPHFFRLEMPASLLDGQGQPWIEGRKVIEEQGAVDESGQRRLGAREAWLELLHCPTGRRITLPAERITNLRTASAAVWSLRWLLGDVSRLAIFGTGRIAGEVALAADRLLTCTTIRAASRSVARCAAFEARFAPQFGSRLAARPDLEWALERAEAVIAAVPAADPLLTIERLAPLRAAVAVEGDPRVKLLAPELVARGPLIVDHVAQAEASGSLLGVDPIGYAMWSDRPATVADAAVGRLSDLADRAPSVLLTGLAAIDLMVGWSVWQQIADPSERADRTDRAEP